MLTPSSCQSSIRSGVYQCHADYFLTAIRVRDHTSLRSMHSAMPMAYKTVQPLRRTTNTPTLCLDAIGRALDIRSAGRCNERQGLRMLRDARCMPALRINHGARYDIISAAWSPQKEINVLLYSRHARGVSTELPVSGYFPSIGGSWQRAGTVHFVRLFFPAR